MGEIKHISALSPSMAKRVVKAWRLGGQYRWRFGIVKRCSGGVGIYLKGNKLRDFISSDTIADFLSSRR